MQLEKLECDKRGVIYDAYRIDGIREEECRSIFLDWVMGIPLEEDVSTYITILCDHYTAHYPNHPMTNILKDGNVQKTTARKRRRRR